MKKNILITLISTLIINQLALSQYIKVTTTENAKELVSKIIEENLDYVEVSNFNIVTGTDYGSVNGLGYFEEPTGNFPFEKGILLTTGDATKSEGPENGTVSEGSHKWLGDDNLNETLGLSASLNASIVEFDFKTTQSYFKLDFIFASEEYGIFQCKYSDGFALLLTDKETNETINLGTIPGTNTPVSAITIKNNTYNADCESKNPEYFDRYFGPTGESTLDSPTNFIGYTKKMTAHANIVENREYHLKLVIADDARDYGDRSYDSAIFIGGFDFGTLSKKKHQKSIFNIYPNPTNSTLFINSPDSLYNGSATINIIDTNGRLVLSKEKVLLNSEVIKLNIDHLTSGVYFLNIEGEQFNTYEKIIKN